MKKRITTQEHREGLINLYEEQIVSATSFMTCVLTSALYKLKNTDIKPKKIENWVVKLEKTYNKLLK